MTFYSQGMYFVSSVLLMRMNMPEEYRYEILFGLLCAISDNTCADYKSLYSQQCVLILLVSL